MKPELRMNVLKPLGVKDASPALLPQLFESEKTFVLAKQAPQSIIQAIPTITRRTVESGVQFDIFSARLRILRCKYGRLFSVDRTVS